MRTWEEDGHLPPRDRGLRRVQPYRHLDHRLPASSIGRNKFLLFKPPWAVVLCSGKLSRTNTEVQSQVAGVSREGERAYKSKGTTPVWPQLRPTSGSIVWVLFSEKLYVEPQSTERYRIKGDNKLSNCDLLTPQFCSMGHWLPCIFRWHIHGH